MVDCAGRDCCSSLDRFWSSGGAGVQKTQIKDVHVSIQPLQARNVFVLTIETKGLS